MSILVTAKKRLLKLKYPKPRTLFVVSAVIVSIIGLVWFVQQIYQANLQRIDPTKYQVITLVSGQVYFGKLQNTTGDYLVIKSPYIAQSVKSSETSADEATTLLRVKDQVYGSEDSIALKSSQVTFWQNLRDDSKVSQAIKSKE